MKKYEAVFILDMRKVEDEGKAFSEELAKNIQSWGGNMVEAIAMGRKQFAREINKRKAGIYWNYIFEIDPLKVKEIRNKYRLDERMIRMLIISYERPENVRSSLAAPEAPGSAFPPPCCGAASRRSRNCTRSA